MRRAVLRSRFSWCCAACGAAANRKHFRRNNRSSGKAVSRGYFPLFKRALLRSHRLSADCGRSENLASSHTVITRDPEQGVSGVLHLRFPRLYRIRHLAVRADCRGKGLAGLNELLTAYLAATDGAKSQVWARTGNAPAEHFYEQHGYRPDGWTSAVLQYN